MKISKTCNRIYFTKHGINFKEASNHFEAPASKDSIAESHGQIVTINTSI